MRKHGVLAIGMAMCVTVGMCSVTAYADDTKTEASGMNSVDPEERPMLAALNITDAQMLEIYEAYDKGLDSEPDDYEAAEAYEEELAASLAAEYAIDDPSDINFIFYYGITNYDKLANAAAGVSTANRDYKIKYGDFVSANTTGSTIVIKAKITPNLTNKMTIEQNYYNVCDLIENQGLDTYKEVQYWAVADMTDGNEGKVISFSVPEDAIELIAKGDFPELTLPNYIEDLWILPSLQR